MEAERLVVVSTDGHTRHREGKVFVRLPRQPEAELSLEFTSVPWLLSVRSRSCAAKGKHQYDHQEIIFLRLGIDLPADRFTVLILS